MEKGKLFLLAVALFTLVTPATKAQGNVVELYEVGKNHNNGHRNDVPIVDDSNLDDFTKENFKIALSVAFASSKLWNYESIAGDNE